MEMAKYGQLIDTLDANWSMGIAMVSWNLTNTNNLNTISLFFQRICVVYNVSLVADLYTEAISSFF